MSSFIKSDLRKTGEYVECFNQYLFDILSGLVDKSNEQVGFQETRNIILLESDPNESSGKKIVRKKPFLPHPKTVNLLIAPGVSQKLLEPIKNFKLLTVESGIPEYFICDVNPKCKYKTDKKSHLIYNSF